MKAKIVEYYRNSQEVVSNIDSQMSAKEQTNDQQNICEQNDEQKAAQGYNNSMDIEKPQSQHDLSSYIDEERQFVSNEDLAMDQYRSSPSQENSQVQNICASESMNSSKSMNIQATAPSYFLTCRENAAVRKLWKATHIILNNSKEYAISKEKSKISICHHNHFEFYYDNVTHV